MNQHLWARPQSGRERSGHKSLGAMCATRVAQIAPETRVTRLSAAVELAHCRVGALGHHQLDGIGGKLDGDIEFVALALWQL